MNLVIDAVGARTGGNITILNNILYYFSIIDPELKVIVYIERTPANNFVIFSNDNITLNTVDDKSLLQKIIWQQIKLHQKVRKFNTNIILSITNVGSFFPKVSQVVYFHQALLFIPNKDLFKFFKFDYILRFKILKFFVIFGFFNSKAVIAQTETVKKSICKQFPSIKSRIHVAYSGVPQIFENSKSNWQAPNQLKNDFKILYVAHPAEYKNFDMLFEAARIAKCNNFKFKFLLTLDKESKNKRYQDFVFNYLEKISEYQVSDYFHFIGSLNNSAEIDEAYKFTDIVIHPSLVESFPQTFTEAMNSSKPLISIDLPYSREIAGDSSLYFHNPQSLVDGIIKYMENDDLLNSMSVKSAKRIHFFDPIKRWSELYNILKSING